MTEETQVIEIPPHPSQLAQQQQQQRNSTISYTIEDKKPKFEPVQFQVSAVKENVKSTSSSNGQDPNPFKIFGAKLRSRPLQGIVPSYDDQNIDTYPQQTGSSLPSDYQQQQYYPPASRESDRAQLRSEASAYGAPVYQQPSSSSFPPTRPNFS